MPNKVGDRFQITVGKTVRDELGVQPGDVAIERVENGRMVVTFVPGPHARSQLGALRPYVKRSAKPIRDWTAAKERAWDARAAEIADVLRRDSARQPRRRQTGAK